MIHLAHQVRFQLVVPERVILDHEIVLVLHGEGEFVTEEGARRIAPGDLLVIPPYVPHRFASQCPEFEHFAVHFDPSADLPSLPERSPYEVILEGGSLFVSHTRLPPADWRRARFQKLLKSWSAETPLGTLQAEAALMEIVASLLRVASVPEGTGAGPDLRILGAVQEIERRLSEPLRVGELARHAGLSPSQFTRQFHALIGEPPASYARKARLHHARELLEDTDTPIKTLAFACGFRNAAHFSRAFFATFGEWPSRHRRHSRQPGAGSERLGLRAQEGLVSTSLARNAE